MKGSYWRFGPVLVWTGPPGGIFPHRLSVGMTFFRRIVWRIYWVKQSQELHANHKAGDFVRWRTVGGQTFCGVLREWDNGTAIVDCIDGKERAV